MMLQKNNLFQHCWEDLHGLKFKLEFGRKSSLKGLKEASGLKDSFCRNLKWPFEQEDVTRTLTKLEQ